MLDVSGGQERARSWPKPRGKNVSPETAEQNEWFRQAQLAARYIAPQIMFNFIEMTKDTPFLPRDILTMMLANRLLWYSTNDGRTIYPMPILKDVSASLDALGAVENSILFRGPEYWTVLLPGDPGDVLELNLITSQPQWGSGGGGGGGSMVELAHYITSGSDTEVIFDAFSDQYEHLQIRWKGWDQGTSTTTTPVMGVQFNGDTGASQYGHTILGSFGNGSGFGNGNNASSGAGCGLLTAGMAANARRGNGIIDITDYTSNDEKQFSCHGGAWQGNVGMLQFTGSGDWRGADPITEIRLFDKNALAFMDGSEFWLYGI